MKRLILSTVLFLIPISVYATTPRINVSTDISYKGAFYLPDPGTGYNWNGGDAGGDSFKGLEYLPPNAGAYSYGTLLVLASRTGGLYKDVGQISIPADNQLVKTHNFNDLNPATMVHAPVDITGGRQSGYVFLGDIHYLPAKGNQARGHIYWSIYGGYIVASLYQNSNGNFGWAETNLDSLSSTGVWRFTNCTDESGNPSNCVYYSGKYLFDAPQSWADTYTNGRSLMQGYKRSGGGTSVGPVISAFAPWGVYQPDNVAGNDTTSLPPDARDGLSPNGTGQNKPTPNHWFDHTPLLQYSVSPSGDSLPLHPSNDAAVNESYTSARWLSLGSKRAIIFAGNRCLRRFQDFTYSYPTSWYPNAGANTNEGYCASPCGGTFWFYDQDDLAAVAQHNKNLYDPQPYARMDLTPYMINGAGGVIMGMAYDEIGQRIYVEEATDPGNGCCYHAIHVFQLTDIGTSPDTTPPPSPTVVLDYAGHESVTFHWNAVVDDSGGQITYVIYRNTVPIAMQATTTYTDSFLAYYPAPVDYYVKAVDPSGNSSSSNTISIDNTNGGNTPLNIYIPTYCLPSTHETSCIKFPYNEYMTMTLTAKGGNGNTLVWSATDLPTGISISSSGVVYGTATGNHNNPWYGCHISVTDGTNIARRKVSVGSYDISTAPQYYCDRDQDGVYGNYPGCGGTETPADDLNSEVTPGLTPTQPTPTNLAVVSHTSSSVTLIWTDAAKRSDPILANTGRKQQNGVDMTYEVYHGTSSGVYGTPVYVGRKTSYTWSGLSGGTHYFAVKAIEFRGLNSAYSTEVSQNLGANTNPPRLTSVTISIDGTTISLLFDEVVSIGAGGNAGWSITMSGGAVTMTYSSGSGTNTLVYTLSRIVLSSETGTVAYTQPGNGVEDLSGNNLATISSQAETNKSTRTAWVTLNGSAFGAYYAEGIDEVNSIAQTSDGNIVMASFTESYAWVNGPGTEVKRGFLVKSSIDGTEQWRRVFGPEGWNITTKQRSNLHWAATHVIESGTDLIVSGYRGTSGAQGVNASLTKFDSSGNEIWDTEFNGATNGDDYFYDVVARTGGGYAAVGHFRDIAVSHADGLLVFADASGVINQSTGVFGFSDNGRDVEYLRVIRKTC